MEQLINSIIVIANDVFYSLGPGYNEVVYHRAFEVALRLNNLNYQSEVTIPIIYKGHNIGHGRIDLIIDNKLIIELKAINNFNNDSIIQIKNYMKFQNITEGMVINFNQKNSNLDIKYLRPYEILNFVNGSFI